MTAHTALVPSITVVDSFWTFEIVGANTRSLIGDVVSYAGGDMMARERRAKSYWTGVNYVSLLPITCACPKAATSDTPPRSVSENSSFSAEFT